MFMMVMGLPVAAAIEIVHTDSDYPFGIVKLFLEI
jgi:hypothetical protein